jgi:hypothetical protein
MAKKFLATFFWKIHSYSSKKVKFRQGMKNLLKLRANNLLKTAYVKGLKRVWREKNIEVDMWKASILYHRIKLFKKTFRGIKRRIKANKTAKTVRQNAFKFRKITCYKIWLKQYLQAGEGKAYNKRLQTKLMRAIFDSLVQNVRSEYMVKSRIKLFDTLHCLNMQKKVVQSLRDYKKVKK